MAKENITKLSKDDLIRAVSAASDTPLYVVTNVLNGLESVITEKLKEVNEDTDISIRLTEGLYVDGIYRPRRIRVNNLTGRSTEIPEKIKVRPRVTKVYEKKVNE